jgi:hypothetical protein
MEAVELAYCSILRFWNEKVHDRSLDATPDSEDDVSVPSYFLK